MALSESISIDDIIEGALTLCQKLPPQYRHHQAILTECKSRLSRGSLHLAVMGMFKRGKSSFVNSLLGLDILPTSVVPVTSVPTVITYGATLRVRIRYFNKKPDLLVHESPKAVYDCLVDHVAEERNPNNSRCVDQAIVECPNPLLENGTIFVDTPGFGSTYTHNTKTTLDLLRKCDAVLFILSPDPPFTLTEVEFLKEVRKAVPRIFFILNKVDLLTPEERGTVDRFIQSVLVKNLGFPAGTRVFHVSAKMGKAAASAHELHPAWRLSGMADIRAEIVDFMMREKYFTLSQAIGDKCRETLAGIDSQLDLEFRDLSAPVESAAREYALLSQSVSTLRNTVDKELGMVDAEIKALCEFAEKTIDSLKSDLQRKATAALRAVLDSVSLKKSSLSQSVRTAFEQQAMSLFDNFSLQVVSSVNKPLKKAIALHCDSFIRMLETSAVSGRLKAASVQDLEKLKDDLEIALGSPWKLEGVDVAFRQIKVPPAGLFTADETRRQRYRDCFTPVIAELFNLNFVRFTMLINDLIGASYKKLKKAVSDRSDELLSALAQGLDEKKKFLDAAEAGIAVRIQEIEKQKKAFKEVEKLLG